MTDIHFKFQLLEKVSRTTTDNRSNFFKAFVQFSSQVDILPLLPVVSASSPEPELNDPEFDDPDLQQLSDEESVPDEDLPEYVPVEENFF
jgi:hypothetical protein